MIDNDPFVPLTHDAMATIGPHSAMPWRQNVSLSGVVKAEGNPGAPGYPCKIEDLSVGIARVALIAGSAGGLARAERQSNDVPARVMLEIEKFGAYAADVVWTRPPQLGLKFRDGPEAMAEILTAIAMRG